MRESPGKIPQKGDDSCKMLGKCIEYTTPAKCNPDCDFYNPKDPIAAKALEEKKVEEKANMLIVRMSTLPEFNKKKEFVLLKKHLFEIQSISPKKVILRFKKRLKDTDTMPDGVYCFADKEGNILNAMHTLKTQIGAKRG